MKMHDHIARLVVVLALIVGCDRSRERAQPVAVPAHEAAAAQNGPYYYGLIEEYKTLIAEDPNNVAALIALANAYAGSGLWKNAVTFYEHALMLDPYNADVRSDLGIAYRNIGQIDRALAEYQMAIKSYPPHQSARFNMGIAYAYDKNNYAAAVSVWKELLEIAPDHPEAEYMKHAIAMFGRKAPKETR